MFKNRVEFTKAVGQLLQMMNGEGESPIIDYCKRSDNEQLALFRKKLSKCDGIKKKSKHQSGMAIDIYFVRNSKLVNDAKSYEYWHKEWEELGGQPMISWDKGHFE